MRGRDTRSDKNELRPTVAPRAVGVEAVAGLVQAGEGAETLGRESTR